MRQISPAYSGSSADVAVPHDASEPAAVLDHCAPDREVSQAGGNGVPDLQEDGSPTPTDPLHRPDADKFIDYTISEPYRYFLLVVGSAACLLASFSYTFALFAQAMVAKADMDMNGLTSVATVMLVFSYFTLPYAFVYDAFGPLPVLLIGTVLLPLGCLLMALAFRGVIPATTVTFCVYLAIMGGGCIVFDIGTVVSVLSWFPTYKGPAVAVMKTFAGLGSAIVACIELAFFEADPASLFFFLMACSVVLGVFCILTMRLPPYHLTGRQQKRLSEAEKAARHRTKQLFLEQRPPRLRMFVGLGFICFLIVYLPVQSAALAFVSNVSHGTKIGLAVVVIVVLAVYPVICLPIRVLGGMEAGHQLTISELEARNVKDGSAISSHVNSRPDSFAVENAHEHVTIAGEEMEKADEEEMAGDLGFIAPQFQTTFAQSLLTLRLWAIFAACFAIMGAQLVIIFQYPYICSALRKKPVNAQFKALLGALSGVGSAIGRLLIAWLENFTQNKPPEQRIPVTVTFFVPVATTLLGLVLYLTVPGDGIAVGHFILAVGNGSAAASAVLVFRGIFAKEPAKHYNFGFLSAMVSAIVLNRVAYGEWYMHVYNKPTTTRIGPYCLDKSCVLMPLLLMLGLNALSFFAVLYVHIDYRRFVRSVINAKNAREAGQEERHARRRQAMEEANAMGASELAALQAKMASDDETTMGSCEVAHDGGAVDVLAGQDVVAGGSSSGSTPPVLPHSCGEEKL